MLNTEAGARLTRSPHWFRFWMAYQLVKLSSRQHPHLYLPLNRDYKPLGYLSRECVEYEAYTHQAMAFASDPHTFKCVWTDEEQLYLYNDEPQSRSDYFVRIERLLSRSANCVKV